MTQPGVSPPAHNSYDDIPYLNRSHEHTHPDRLATLARLLGLEPAPVERCRVLELGCANGRNLLSMAAFLPGSTFVGVDLSARQIADGRATVAELGLGNLDLRHASILDVDESYGSFDYIIAHGVYSWVPGPVQDKLLSICRERLAPDGVAHVSFNTFPGWHAKLPIREMLLHQVRGLADPQSRLRHARDFIAQLRDLVAPEGATELTAYAAVLRAEADVVLRGDDDYIYHEYLEEDNAPLYFHEFVERLERHGLQYLADADRGLRPLDVHGAEVAAILRQLGSQVEQEQYLDYVFNRTFRCAVLVPAEARPSRALTSDRLQSLFLRSALRPVEPAPDLTGPASETFSLAGGDLQVKLEAPVTKSALAILGEAWPRALPFPELLARACERAYGGHALGESPVVRARERAPLARALLETHMRDRRLVGVHAHAPRLACAPGERPLAALSARHEALLGQVVTNAYHQVIQLNAFLWQLLPFLDGTRDRATLADIIAANPSLTIERQGEPVHGLAERRQAALERLEDDLAVLVEVGLLVEGGG